MLQVAAYCGRSRTGNVGDLIVTTALVHGPCGLVGHPMSLRTCALNVGLILGHIHTNYPRPMALP